MKINNLVKKSQDSLKYLVASTLLAIPLYPKFPLFSIPNSSVSVRLEDFLVLAMSLAWILSISPSLKKFLQQSINRSILVFFFVTLSSVLTGILLTKTVAPEVGLLHWARRVEYMIAFFIGASSVKSREDISFYIKVILLSLLYVFAYGVGQKHLNFPVITTQNAEYAKGAALRYLPGGHLVSTFAGHYDLAAYILLSSPLSYILFFSDKKLLQKIFGKINLLLIRIFIASTILMGLWLLVNTASRISVVSYLMGTVMALILVKRAKFIPLVMILILVFVSMSTNLVDRYINIFQVTVEKVVSQVEDSITVYAQGVAQTPVEDRSTSIRLNVEWPRAIRALSKDPIFGTGFSSITLATDNDYLRMLGETGFFGFFAFMLIILNVLHDSIRRLYKNIKSMDLETIFLAAIFASLPGLALNMLFIDILEASKFAILFWLLLGISLNLKYKQSMK